MVDLIFDSPGNYALLTEEDHKMIRDMKKKELEQALSGNGKVLWTCSFSDKKNCSHYPGGGKISNLRVGHAKTGDGHTKEVVLCIKHAEDLFRARGFRSAFLNFVLENELEQRKAVEDKKKAQAKETAEAFDLFIASPELSADKAEAKPVVTRDDAEYAPTTAKKKAGRKKKKPVNGQTGEILHVAVVKEEETPPQA